LQIREACQDLLLDDKTLREIMSKFLHEIDRGLKKVTHPDADIKCFITYVQDLPNGKGKVNAINMTFLHSLISR